MTVKKEVGNLDVNAAWEEYVNTGRMDNAVIRPVIAESWRRCCEADVDPYDGRSHIIANPKELNQILNGRQCLIDIARPFMANLYRFVAGSGFIVMLTDEYGYILEAMGDDDTLVNAEQISFCKGANWGEEAVGTNAIGTAMVIKKPLQVSGAEHYCQKHHSWTCSAAPIFNQHNELIGVLDMSGPSSEVHLHTLGMVVAAVEAIMDQMSIQSKNRELTVSNARLQSISNSMSDGVILVDESAVIIGINPVTEEILGQSSQDMSGKALADIFAYCVNTMIMLETGKVYKDIEILVDTSRGRIYCLVSGEPIKDDTGKITGGVIFIKPTKSIKKLVNRFSGSHATFYFKDILGVNREFLNAVQMAYRAADTMSSVMLLGESGTGKEILAQAMHNKSSRRKGPFVAVNCGAIPWELISSELFGYVEGAFTGAKKGGRPGKFELASGGTLFLDEIGEMPLGQQVSLLRVLQEKKITRLGGDKPIPTDVRIICATNKNLQSEVKKGNFRQDLYYRLNVVSIIIPPLRERPEDIPILFDHMVKEISSKLDFTIKQVEPDIIKYMCQHDWPGNVRELQNVVERMINITTTQELRIEHLPCEIISPSAAISGDDNSNKSLTMAEKRQKINEHERELIASLLSEFRGNISRVAREMGVSRNTVYRKMRQCNIDI